MRPLSGSSIPEIITINALNKKSKQFIFSPSLVYLSVFLYQTDTNILKKNIYTKRGTMFRRTNKGITAKAWLDANGCDSSHINIGPVRGKLVEEGLTVTQLTERLQDAGSDEYEDIYKDVVGRSDLRSLGLPDYSHKTSSSTSTSRSSETFNGVRRYANLPKKGQLVSKNKRLICFPEGDGKFVIGLACHLSKKVERIDKLSVDDYLKPGSNDTVFVDEFGVEHTLFVEHITGMNTATYGVRGSLS